MDTSTVVMMTAALITLAVVYVKSPEAAGKGLNATGSLILEITPRMIAAFLLGGGGDAVLEKRQVGRGRRVLDDEAGIVHGRALGRPT